MWDIRYRPKRFSEIVGQEGNVTVLKARLQEGTALDTSYLFYGMAGTGKTTLARILARALICQQLNLEDPEPCNECDNCLGILNETSGAFAEFDAASRGTIDNIRAIVNDLPFAVFGAPKRIYLLDEVHRLSKDSQDVFLKPLEEKKMVGLFCTTEPEKIRGPIRSRCEEYAIRRSTKEDLLKRARYVLACENVSFEEEAISTIVDFCGGHVRDILNKLEMIAQLGSITQENVVQYLNLGVLSTYYDILLALQIDIKRALDLADGACQRVTPEEVSTGLAEAAMNAYRLANGMSAEFVYTNKDLARKTYEAYGLGLIQLAEYFLRPRRVSQIGLMCDIIGLTRQGVPVQALPPAPLQIQVAAPMASQPDSSTQQAVAQQPVHAPPLPSPAPSPAKSLNPAPRGDLRSDGIGNLGSRDIEALTEFDKFVVPQGRTKKKQQLSLDADIVIGSGPGMNSMDPAQWKLEFEKVWNRSRR